MPTPLPEEPLSSSAGTPSAAGAPSGAPDGRDRLADLEDSLARLREESLRRLPEFVGLTQDEAASLAARVHLGVRFWSEDEQAFTADYQPSRLTLDVRTGKVTAGWVG